MIKNNPVGIFDSGIGGISIAKRIRELLPHEDILYVADSLHAPYGEKSKDYITQRASAIVQFMLKNNAKAVVVACNTATVSSIQKLRAEYKIPIVGVEPGVKPAAFCTKTGVVGVMATTQTLNSTSFSDLSKSFSSNATIEVQPCPGLVEQVEALSFETDTTEHLVRQHVSSLLSRGADNIVLGCTHYSFLAPVIRKIAGPDIEIIETDMAVARETMRRLQVEDLISTNQEPGRNEFWTSGDLTKARQQLQQLWAGQADVFELPQ